MATKNGNIFAVYTFTRILFFRMHRERQGLVQKYVDDATV